jgi:hypothetical protein
MMEEKSRYYKITSLEFKDAQFDEEWYTIAPTLEEARQLADKIGMPTYRKEQVVYLTEDQYNAIPEAH